MPRTKKRLAPRVTARYKVKVEYVDPDPGNRPWGYRVVTSGGLDIAIDVARKAHLKRYAFFERQRPRAGETGVVERYRYDWIAGRELSNLLDALELWGYVSCQADVFVDHPEPTDNGSVSSRKRRRSRRDAPQSDQDAEKMLSEISPRVALE